MLYIRPSSSSVASVLMVAHGGVPLVSRSMWTVDDIADQHGRTAVITGANSGLGLQTARALAGKRATVVMACRNQEKGAAALQSVREQHPAATVELLELDLADLASVRKASEELLDRHPRIDMLFN